jgi:hypothetical protein
MSRQQQEQFLLKVRVSDDGTINGDDLSDERWKIIGEEKTKLYFSLLQFNDIVYQLDARYFEEIKDKSWAMIKSLTEKTKPLEDNTELELERENNKWLKENNCELS